MSAHPLQVIICIEHVISCRGKNVKKMLFMCFECSLSVFLSSLPEGSPQLLALRCRGGAVGWGLNEPSGLCRDGVSLVYSTVPH